MIPTISTWLGAVSYSLIAGVAVVWLGISIANWQTRRSLCAIYLGTAAFCWAVFFVALTIIASDLLPNFTGVYVALVIRLAAFCGTLALLTFTILYLHKKRTQEPC